MFILDKINYMTIKRGNKIFYVTLRSLQNKNYSLHVNLKIYHHFISMLSRSRLIIPLNPKIFLR